MSHVTSILSAIEQGDPQAARQLLPLVYDELRRLAAEQLAHEKPGQTLDATALVHEAYLRLVGARSASKGFDNRRHFFAAAAEAMRRILVENARKKKCLKRGGDRQRAGFLEEQVLAALPDVRLIELDAALRRFAGEQPRMAELVKLRYFVGMTIEQAAEMLGISLRTAKRDWTFARAWLRRAMDREE